MRHAAGMLCAISAVTACSAIWGIDDLTYAPRETGSAGSASQASGGNDTGGQVTMASGGASTGGMAGGPPGPPPLDCLDALENGAVDDGVYTIDPDGDGTGAPMQVYCDMTTAGGGWTLVYAYTFTNYQNFSGDSNAVTPRPSWPLNVGDSVPVSTQTPLSLTDYNAMDFALWAALGSEFLAVSNITHWVRCSADSGSLVTNTGGTLICENVMNIAPVCNDTAPNAFVPSDGAGCRPAITLQNGLFICWDGRTNNNWPTHDPCAINATNHVANVLDPHGAILLRRQQ